MYTRLPIRQIAFIQILAMFFLACAPLLAQANMINTASVVADQQLEEWPEGPAPDNPAPAPFVISLQENVLFCYTNLKIT